jgi:hypothetical protein
MASGSSIAIAIAVALGYLWKKKTLKRVPYEEMFGDSHNSIIQFSQERLCQGMCTRNLLLKKL